MLLSCHCPPEAAVEKGALLVGTLTRAQPEDGFMSHQGHCWRLHHQQGGFSPKIPTQGWLETWFEFQKCPLSSQTRTGGGGGSVTLGKAPTTSVFGSRLHRGINGNFLVRLQGCGAYGRSQEGPKCPCSLETPTVTGQAPWACSRCFWVLVLAFLGTSGPPPTMGLGSALAARAVSMRPRPPF